MLVFFTGKKCQILLSCVALILVISKTTLQATALTSEINDVRDIFERDGYVVLRGLLEPYILRKWKRFGENLFRQIFVDLHSNGHSTFPTHRRVLANETVEYAMDRHYGTSDRGFREITMRSKGRYEISLMHSNSHTRNRPSIDPLLRSLESSIPPLLYGSKLQDVHYMYSLIMAAAYADGQNWHTDGPHRDLSQHLHAHAINVFIPLVDVTTEAEGPTEFFPASHYQTRATEVSTDDLTVPFAPFLNVGDALVFDYRVLHRGLPNLVDRDRPVLVFTFMKKDFQDTLNWPGKSVFDPPERVVVEEDGCRVDTGNNFRDALQSAKCGTENSATL